MKVKMVCMSCAEVFKVEVENNESLVACPRCGQVMMSPAILAPIEEKEESKKEEGKQKAA